MIKYGLIGSGMMGQEHIRNLALIDGADVVAVSDPDTAMRDAAATACGGRSYATHAEMLAAEDLDALVIAAPNHTHHGILRDILATDLPILCEKPLGISPAECAEIEDWAKGRQAPVWVAMEYRYMLPVARLREAVSDGAAGPLHMLTIREHRFPFLPKVGDWNRFSANTGGTLVEKCCHHFDLMRLILGAEPKRVYASGAMSHNHIQERYDGQTPDIVDNAYVIVDFDNSTRGMLELCMFAEGAYWQEVVSVVGETQRIEAKIPGPARFSTDGKERDGIVSFADRASRQETTETLKVDQTIQMAGDHHGSTYYQHVKFRDMVRYGGQPEVTLADGRRAVEMGAAAEESIRTGMPVDL